MLKIISSISLLLLSILLGVSTSAYAANCQYLSDASGRPALEQRNCRSKTFCFSDVKCDGSIRTVSCGALTHNGQLACPEASACVEEWKKGAKVSYQVPTIANRSLVGDETKKVVEAADVVQPKVVVQPKTAVEPKKVRMIEGTVPATDIVTTPVVKEKTAEDPLGENDGDPNGR